MEAANKRHISLAEYQQLEEEADIRYEYHDGRRGTVKCLLYRARPESIVPLPPT